MCEKNKVNFQVEESENTDEGKNENFWQEAQQEYIDYIKSGLEKRKKDKKRQ